MPFKAINRQKIIVMKQQNSTLKPNQEKRKENVTQNAHRMNYANSSVL